MYMGPSAHGVGFACECSDALADLKPIRGFGPLPNTHTRTLFSVAYLAIARKLSRQRQILDREN